MKKNFAVITITIVVLFSCTPAKHSIVREHGDCNVTSLHFDNKLNDTTRIKFIKGGVFDTTATLIHGYIIDQSYRPVQNCEVTLFSIDDKYRLQTNNNGEFELFSNMPRGHWNLLIKHPDYICLYIMNVVQTGGQWFYIKMSPK